MEPEPIYSTKQLEVMLGAPQWKIRLAVDRIRPEVPRIGVHRVVAASLLEQVEKNLAKVTKKKK